MQQPARQSHSFQRALAFHKEGRLTEAEQIYLEILRAAPGDVRAGHLLGMIRYQQGRYQEALELIGRALKGSLPQPLSDYGLVLQALGRLDEALAAFDRALLLAPQNPDTLSRRGNVLFAMGRHDAALASYLAALDLRPKHVDALNNCGVVLNRLRRFPEALASFDRALAENPGHAEAWNNRGNALRALHRGEEALLSYDRAIRCRPRYADAWNNRGAGLWELRNLPEALKSLDTALDIAPGHPEVLLNRGVVLRELKRLDDALRSLEAAIAALPAYAEAHYQRGQVLQLMDRPAEAMASFEKSMALDPGHPHAQGALAGAMLYLCDWRLAADKMDGSNGLVQPLVALARDDDLQTHLECARRFAAHTISAVVPLPGRQPVRRDRICLAYLSADFKEHATAYLAAELFERHDRARFEVLGISHGPDDGSAMRARLVRAFDQFHDARSVSDRKAAELLAGHEADILIDLNGHTYGARPGILAWRGAPIQVNYLGYPGTMGADLADYIIADETVLPSDQQPFYAEKIVHLPDCYQVSGSRDVARAAPFRQACGLPETGFVFCCFNNLWKINAGMFDIWMRLLGAVPGSVLWLLAGSPESKVNLSREAAMRGIDPGRLVFAPRLSQPDHLARHGLADLFLDTLPYNAHTTASDALWMGLPVVTCLGRSFAGRVAASLLRAAGVPELAADTLDAYEALALRLARDPVLLKCFRDRLRSRGRLFDVGRFCRNIEKAYERMFETACAGKTPHGFAVEAEN